MAVDNRDWGYRRIQGALSNLGHEVARSTIAAILERHRLEPAPERSQKTTWLGRRAELPSASMKERRRETRAIHFPLNDCHSPQ